MMLGVDHIGVGVPDMDRALAFYAELGFRTVAFDYTGPLPGLEPVAGREVGEARVVVLRSENPTKLGPGSLKLVQTLDAAVPPLPEGIGWGEPGICEICMHVKDQEALHRRLVDGGVPSLMEPNETVTTPNDAACGLSYVADPFGSKIELIEWLGLQDGWPTPSGPQGVNHVAFGVTDMDRTRDYYRGLGFTGTLFDGNDYFPPMDPWFSGPPPKQHMILMTNPYGAGIEPVRHDPPSPDMRGEWGHAGPMEFGIGTRNLDLAISKLGANGYRFVDEPATIASPDGALRYVYLEEPDGLYVCICEARY